MKSNTLQRLASVASIFTLTTLLASQGEQVNPPVKPVPENRGQQPNQDRPAGRADALMASWIRIDNDNVVALAQYANGKSQNEQVKQLAMKIQEDHSRLSDALKQYTVTGRDPRGGDGMREGAEKSAGDPNGSGRSDAPRGRDNRPYDASGKRSGETDDSIAGRGMTAGEPFHHMALLRELGTKCLENAKKELETKSGAEFDRCFVGMQIAAHGALGTMLEVFAAHASDDLKKVLEDGKSTVKGHCDEAKSVMKKLESGARSDQDAPSTGDRKK